MRTGCGGQSSRVERRAANPRIAAMRSRGPVRQRQENGGRVAFDPPAVSTERASARPPPYQRDPRFVVSLLPPAIPAAPAAGSPEPLCIVPVPDDCCEPLEPGCECCAPVVPDCACCEPLVLPCRCCEPDVPLPYVAPLPVPEYVPPCVPVALEPSRISSVRPRCCWRGMSTSISRTPSRNDAVADSLFVPSGSGIVR